jgi:DNA-binding MarR family transcriptional regulator
MSRRLTVKDALSLWRGTLVASVRRDAPDLTARQLAILLTVYLEPGPHTVRGLSWALDVAKPAIVRALDRLGRLELIRRRRDDRDRRNVLIQRTVAGSVWLADFSELIAAHMPGVEGETLRVPADQ